MFDSNHNLNMLYQGNYKVFNKPIDSTKLKNNIKLNENSFENSIESNIENFQQKKREQFNANKNCENFWNRFGEDSPEKENEFLRRKVANFGNYCEEKNLGFFSGKKNKEVGSLETKYIFKDKENLGMNFTKSN